MKYILTIILLFEGLFALSQNCVIADSKPLQNDTSFLIITNRKYNPSSPIGDYFTNEVAEDGKLHYITVLLKNNKCSFRINSSISEAFESLHKDKDVLIFVHGFGYYISNVMEVSYKLRDIYNLNVICFSWASNIRDKNKGTEFETAKINIEKSIPAFCQFIESYQAYKDSTLNSVKTTLLLHSLGNYFMQKVIEDSLYQHFKPTLFDNIILNAAAVNAKKHKHWIEKMDFQKRIYVTSNKNDFMLRGARFLQHATQLGVKTKNPLANNAIYVNFTKAIGFTFSIIKRRGHNYFLDMAPKENSYIFNFYQSVLHGNDYSSFQTNDTNSYRRFKPIIKTSKKYEWGLSVQAK